MKMSNKKKYKYLALILWNPFLLTDTRASKHALVGRSRTAYTKSIYGVWVTANPCKILTKSFVICLFSHIKMLLKIIVGLLWENLTLKLFASRKCRMRTYILLNTLWLTQIAISQYSWRPAWVLYLLCRATIREQIQTTGPWGKLQTEKSTVSSLALRSRVCFEDIHIFALFSSRRKN